MRKISVSILILLLALCLGGCRKHNISSDFNIAFQYGVTEDTMVTLDTYNKVLTLGTAPNLKKQIKVKVPQEKLSEIYDLLIEDRVQGYDGDYKGTILEETPNTKFSIKTTIRGRTKIVNGDSTTASYTKRFEIEKLLEFRDYMIEYIESLPEYKELK